MPSDASEDLTVSLSTAPALPVASTAAVAQVPATLLRAGENAAFAADEFFSAHISNPYTRRGLTEWPLCDVNGPVTPVALMGLNAPVLLSLMRGLDGFLERNRDRALFDLAPKPQPSTEVSE